MLERLKGTQGISALRVGGYALYNLWLLATFYNTFLLMSARDFRAALYLNQTVSLAALALALLVFPLALRHADKWVLSWRCSLPAGAALALLTALLAFLDPGDALGGALIVLSGVGTGVASGILFLGWGRIYADTGTRLAMLEVGLSWAASGVACALLSLAPPLAASALVVAGTLGSAVLLRRAAFGRPTRPQPAHEHHLQRRTRRMFARGLVACAGMGLVAGFSDVICGFRFVVVPDGYEILLALSCAAVALVVAVVAIASDHDFVAYAYRLTTLLLAAGCLLTPFVSETMNLSNVIVFGAYTGFVILLCVVCVDVSNYFDQPATRTFGLAFFTLYAAELVGNGAGHLVTDVAHAGPAALNTIAFALTLAVVFANLFLFTEKDLTETSLGEMTDDDSPDGSYGHARALSDEIAGAAAAQPGQAGETGGWSPEQRIACIVALFQERYGLTPREADVLPLVIKGRTIARIQEELHISQGTVSTHIRHIYQKADAHNRQALLDLIDEIPEAELAALAGDRQK